MTPTQTPTKAVVSAFAAELNAGIHEREVQLSGRGADPRRFAELLFSAEDRLDVARGAAAGHAPAAPEGFEAARAARDVLADCPSLAALAHALVARVARLQRDAEALARAPETEPRPEIVSYPRASLDPRRGFGAKCVGRPEFGSTSASTRAQAVAAMQARLDAEDAR